MTSNSIDVYEISGRMFEEILGFLKAGSFENGRSLSAYSVKFVQGLDVHSFGLRHRRLSL
jgi:hypothetical protein